MKARQLNPDPQTDRLEREAIERFRRLLDPSPPPRRKRSASVIRLVWDAFAPREALRADEIDLEAIRIRALHSAKRDLWR